MNNDMEFFRNSLAIQWDEINKRFNGLDKKGILKRNYIFVPDLEDIIVFKYVNGDSNWDVAENYKNQIDINKFQLVVSYDFFQQVDEGSGGYGGKCPNGLNHIKVTCYSKNCDEIRKYAGIEGLSDESIVHELGHFRGLIDTYLCELNASDNLINNQGFQAERGNMMGACYEPTETIEWSEYEMYVINATGCDNCDIGKTMAKYLANDIEITVTEDGNPVNGFTINCYKKQNGKIGPNIYHGYKSDTDRILINPIDKLFYWSAWEPVNAPWTYENLILVEAISQKTDKKGYTFIPVYEVHKQGLKDKLENPITGRSVFRTTIDIK